MLPNAWLRARGQSRFRPIILLRSSIDFCGEMSWWFLSQVYVISVVSDLVWCARPPRENSKGSGCLHVHISFMNPGGTCASIQLCLVCECRFTVHMQATYSYSFVVLSCSSVASSAGPPVRRAWGQASSSVGPAGLKDDNLWAIILFCPLLNFPIILSLC